MRWRSACRRFGADVFTQPGVADRNYVMGPGTWALNLGVHKDFHFGERVTSQFGADVDNIFNHPLFSPNQRAGGGCGDFALLGDFRLRVDPDTGNPLLIDKVNDVFSNPGFGRLSSSVAQDDVNNRPAGRLRIRF